MAFGCKVERCSTTAIVYRQGLQDKDGNTMDAPVCTKHAGRLDEGRSFTMKGAVGLWGKARETAEKETDDE